MVFVGAQHAAPLRGFSMEHFLNILILPDNIPIVMMLIFIAYCLSFAIREMIENDKLIEKGEKDKVYDRMIR